jgi:hypothetical protein
MSTGLIIKTGHDRFFPPTDPVLSSLARCQIIYATEKTALNDEQTKPRAFSQ